MRLSKHGLRAFGLCVLAALSLMAFSAVSAQAAPPEWKVATKTIGAGEEAKIKNEADGTIQWLLEVQPLSILIHCSTLTASGSILPNGASKGVLSFTNCTLLVLNVEKKFVTSTNCAVVEPIVANVKDQLFLDGSTTYDRFEPAEGTTFTTIKFKTVAGKEECLLPAENKVTGQQIVECPAAAPCSTEAVTHLVSAVNNTTLFGEAAQLKFGTNKAKLEGSGILSLESPVGKNWSGIG